MDPEGELYCDITPGSLRSILLLSSIVGLTTIPVETLALPGTKSLINLNNELSKYLIKRTKSCTLYLLTNLCR